MKSVPIFHRSHQSPTLTLADRKNVKNALDFSIHKTIETNIYLFIFNLMQKKPRVDKRNNIAKVAEAITKNPNKTLKELSKETKM
jgi:hypothetical protein